MSITVTGIIVTGTTFTGITDIQYYKIALVRILWALTTPKKF